MGQVLLIKSLKLLKKSLMTKLKMMIIGDFNSVSPKFAKKEFNGI